MNWASVTTCFPGFLIVTIPKLVNTIMKNNISKEYSYAGAYSLAIRAKNNLHSDPTLQLWHYFEAKLVNW